RQATGCGWRAMRANVRPLGGAGTGGPESRFRGAALPVMRRLDTASRALWQGGGGGARGEEKREPGTGNREQGTGNRERHGCRCLPFDPSCGLGGGEACYFPPVAMGARTLA